MSEEKNWNLNCRGSMIPRFSYMHVYANICIYIYIYIRQCEDTNIDTVEATRKDPTMPIAVTSGWQNSEQL